MDYKAPFLYFSAHLETILPALTRKVSGISYQRERIGTPDNDFLDLDWLRQDSERLVIISHGLEGNSTRPYMKGMARAFYEEKYDVLAWNYRGCSDEVNKQLRFYHSGATDDLQVVIEHAMPLGYQQIFLIGFSLGGNITLKYLGENAGRMNDKIVKAAVFSVPLDLHSSCQKISQPSNFVYSRRFLKNLKEKVVTKAALMPDAISLAPLNKIKTLKEFDDEYTAPIHGFKDAIDYYNSCSSINFLSTITVPTLIVNAKNDPFLTPECYPYELVDDHPFITFEAPERGGHVGFTEFNQNQRFWSEKRALQYFDHL